MKVVEAIRAPGDVRQSAYQLALPVDWEAGWASNLDEDPGRLGLHGPFLAARDFEHGRVPDILIGHFGDVHAVVRHLVGLAEDVQPTLDQLLLGFPCESRRTQDGDYGHGFFSFVYLGFERRGRASNRLLREFLWTPQWPRPYLPSSARLVPIPSRCGRTLSGRPQKGLAPPS